MQDILLKLQQELNKTIVFITHDLDEALRIGDSIAILRDGEIIQQGDPQDIILKPNNDYIVDFIQDINRGRVIRIKSIMQKNGVVEGPSFHQDDALEDVLPGVVDSLNHEANVIDNNKKVIGSIALKRIALAIAKPSVEPTSDAIYR